MATNSYGEKPKSKKSEDILATARKRFQLAEEAEREIRDDALDDLKFRAGEQWPEEIKRERDFEGRPSLVINRIPQFIRQVTNDQRQNRPSIKVHPVDDKADIETARIYQGIIRHIEYNSGADAAYDTAFEGAATQSFGFWRIITDYVSPDSFEQEILVKRISNPFSVYLDPYAKEPDGSDANWGFIFEDVPKDDYIALYGESKLASMVDWSSIGHQREGWITANSCRVAEYYYKEFKTVDICLLESGGSVEKSKLEELYPEGIPKELIVSERKARVPQVKWCKINGIEVLEETDWPGRWIPIVPVYGDELNINGKIVREGIVRHAKDSQRMYNYWASAETESIALAPKAPFIVAEGQIPPEYEFQWKTANRKSHAYLTYKPTTHQGVLVGAPQRNFFEPAVQAITNARLQASEDLKATTGIYDAALGNRSNETSGVAIARRNQQAQTSNFHLIDNLNRALRHSGRIKVDLIPHIYDTARAARIIGEEGEQEVIRINEEFKRKGEMVKYDLGVGKYDVIMDTGPSFATKREEASQTMLELSKAAPNLMAVAPDLIVKNLDFPGSQEIAERLKKTLPPGVAESKDQKPIPPEVQAQLQQMDQMITQLTEKLNEANEDIRTKKMELESKERIEFAKLETQLELEKLKQAQQFAIDSVNRQIAELQMRQEMVGISQPISTQPQNMNLNGSGLTVAATQEINQPDSMGFHRGEPPMGV